MREALCTVVGQCYNSNAYSTESSSYAGFNYNNVYYTYRMQFITPAFVEPSSKINFRIKWYNEPDVAGGTDLSLRWALMTSDNQLSKYRNTKDEVADSTDRLATGRVEFFGITKDNMYTELSVETSALKPNTTYFLYFWGDGSTKKQQNYGTVDHSTEHTVTVSYVATYDVAFDANGIGTAPEAITVEKGAAIDLPSMSESGYSFFGWSEDPNAEDGIMGEYTPTASVTLYAVWKKLFVITFDNNGKGASVDPQTVVEGNSIQLPEATAKGYKFLGWAEIADATEGIVGEYTPTDSVVLYAIWKRKGSIVVVNGQRWYVSVPVNGKLMRCRLAVGTAEGLVYV